MDSGLNESKKSLIGYLPAIYQDDGACKNSTFLSRFLNAFERLLLDADWQADDVRAAQDGFDWNAEPLERKVSALPSYFDPRETPEEFLTWLGGWVALTFRSELSVSRRRELLAAIVPLYRIRGTRGYLEEVLRICLDVIATVSDVQGPRMQIGKHSRVGSDTYVDGGPPHFFRVRLLAGRLDASVVEAQSRLARSLIELSKPAHTHYELEFSSHDMQVGVCSTIGLDTMLGSATA